MKDRSLQSYVQDEIATEIQKVNSVIFLRSLILSWILYSVFALVLLIFSREVLGGVLIGLWVSVGLIWGGTLEFIRRFRGSWNFSEWEERLGHLLAILVGVVLFLTWVKVVIYSGEAPLFEWIGLLPLFVLCYLSVLHFLLYNVVLVGGFGVWFYLTRASESLGGSSGGIFGESFGQSSFFIGGHYGINTLIAYGVIMVIISFYKVVFSSELHEVIRLRLLAGFQVKDLEKQQKELHYQAYYDFLTGLYNRAMMEKKIINGIKLAQAQASSICVLFIDVDKFKSINDRFGHRNGDFALLSIASRLREGLEDAWFQEHVREDEDKGFLARLSGDEFIIVLVDVEERRVKNICRRLMRSCAKSYKMPDIKRADTPRLSVSIGAVYLRFHGDKVYNRRQNATVIRRNLLRESDTSMYQAKKKRNTFFFSEY